MELARAQQANDHTVSGYRIGDLVVYSTCRTRSAFTRDSVASTEAPTASTNWSQFVSGVKAVEGVEGNLNHFAGGAGVQGGRRLGRPSVVLLGWQRQTSAFGGSKWRLPKLPYGFEPSQVGGHVEASWPRAVHVCVSPNPPTRRGLGVGTRGEGRGTRRSALDSDKWGRWRPLVVVGGADGGPGSGAGAGSAGQHAGEDNRGPGRCDSVGRLGSLVDGSGAVGAVRQAKAGLAIEPGRE